MSLVWERSKQTGSNLLLLLAIADNANDNGYAWPGYDYLARKTRLGREYVRKLAHELCDTNELEIVRTGSGRTPNMYRVKTEILGTFSVVQEYQSGMGVPLTVVLGYHSEGVPNTTDPSLTVNNLLLPDGENAAAKPAAKKTRKGSAKGAFSLGGKSDDQTLPPTPPKQAPPPLSPATPGAIKVFLALANHAEQKGRRGPKQFETEAQKEKLEAAEKALPPGEIEKAIKYALEQGIVDRKGMVNVIAKWAANYKLRSTTNRWSPGRPMGAAKPAGRWSPGRPMGKAKND
jgi:hypothetical protein